MGKKILLLLVCAFMSTSMALAQKEMTGTVVDSETGEPIVGAVVRVTGQPTTGGVLTDIDGKFQLRGIPSDAKTVTVSFMGTKTQEVPVRANVVVRLEPEVKSIDEVMVVAFGTQKKGTFTGSAAIVGANEIEKVQVTNPVDALRGKAAGVQVYSASGAPGTTPTIRIRGVNSINAGNAPLIVLDGSPYDGSLNDINPADVESMTVLKDASSTALYGARGGNGVILITTKTAKKNTPVVVNFDAKWGSNMRGVPEYNKIKSPAQYYETWYGALNTYAKNMWGWDATQRWKWANENLINGKDTGLGYNVYTLDGAAAGQYLIGQDGRLNPNAVLGSKVTRNGQTYTLLPDDWTDATYHNGLRQEYSLSATAGNDKGTFYAAANYLTNEGVTTASDYSRFTGRMKADYQLKSWLRVGGNMNYGHYTRNYLGNDGETGSSGNVFALTNIAPIYPLYVRDENGNIIFDKVAGINTYDYGDGGVNGVVRPYLTQANPLASNQLDVRNREGNTFNGTGTIDLMLPYGFTVTSINNVYLHEYRYTNTTNRYYGQYASSNGQVVKEHYRNWSYNYQQRLNWHQTYGKNDIEVMFGHEYYRRRDYDLWGNKTQQSSDYNTELDGAVVTVGTGSSMEDYNTESWMGRAMYNYDERYFANLSLMREASSIFAPENRWGTFWSLGAGWMLNKEKWFKAKWVDELKLKASYGENGNDDIGYFRYTNTSVINNSNGSVSIQPSTYGNRDISWEKNGKFNIGVEFSFLRDRIYGSFEYYLNNTFDMLMWFPMAPSYGYTGYYANVGNMRNTGVELDVHADAIRTKDFTWNIYANLTSNHNKVTSLPEERRTQEKDGRMGFSSSSYFISEGMSRYSYFTKKYAGVYTEDTWQMTEDVAYDPAKAGSSMWYGDVYKTDNGKPVYDENGEKIAASATTTYSSAKDYIVGDMLPKVYGGFGTGFKYKGFDLSLDFQYQLGGHIYDSNYASLMGVNSLGQNFHKDILNSWTPENNSNLPRMQFNDTYMNGGSDRFITSARYLSLQNITFGYTVPAACLKKLGITKLRVYTVADNIWVCSARRGLDPRMGITGSGISPAYYSAIRSISGGVNLTF